MTDLIQWGLAVVQWVQSFRHPILDQFFLAINFLGEEDFYLLFLPFLFWCVQKQLAYRLAFLFLFSSYVNQFFKNLFAAPRPYQVDPKLYAPLKTTGYGIPSGHTQSATVTWGYFATQLKTPLWWTLAIALPLLVGIARMYLGDHFPQDVIAGALIGAILVALFAAFQARAAQWLTRASFAMRLALAIIVPLVLAALALKDSGAALGALWGFAVGLVLEEEYLRFEPRGEWWKQIAKLVIGLAIALGLRVGIKPLLPEGDVFTLARYAVIGFWLSFGAPWVFVKSKLAVMNSRQQAVESRQ
jgi:membrane-associated phospholipid phosphatase